VGGGGGHDVLAYYTGSLQGVVESKGFEGAVGCDSPERDPPFQYLPYSCNASHIAIMFSGGTSA